MRKVRAPVTPLGPGERTLDAAGTHYVARVLRLAEGDTFVAFDPSQSLEADARVVSLSPEGLRVTLGPPRPGQTVPLVPVTWIHGMAKGEKLDAVVRDATELGATRFVVADSARAVVKLTAEKGDARRLRWDKIAREAARQCGRSDAPVVDGPLPWENALTSVPDHAARFLLWEEATRPLAPPLLLALSTDRPIAFAAGPEGGLSPAEARTAEDAGWSPVSLGSLILRTETVAAAVLGAVRVFGR
jgi:16S rRNA (uracil1498-N3)-methyltransferase